MAIATNVACKCNFEGKAKKKRGEKRERTNDVKKGLHFKRECLPHQHAYILEMSSATQETSAQDFPRTYPVGYQWRALLLKNASQQARQRGTNACQILTPVVVIVVLGVMHLVVLHMLPKSDNALVVPDAEQLSISAPHSVWPTVTPVVEYTASGATTRATLGVLSPLCAGTGMLGRVVQTEINGSKIGLPVPRVCVPWFEEVASVTEAFAEIKEEKLYRNSLRGVEEKGFRPSANHSFPFAVVEFEEVSEKRLAFSIAAEEQATQGFSTQAATALDRAAIRSSLLSAWLKGVHAINVTISPSVRGMPYTKMNMAFDPGSMFFGYLAPFAIAFLLPVYVFSIVHEKQQKLREMMKMVGLEMSSYWAINFIYDLLLYVIVMVLFIGIGLAFGLRVFRQAAWHIQVLLYGGWGLAQVSLSFLLSTFFSRSRTATIVSYLFTLFSIIVGLVVNIVGFRISEGKEAHPVYLLINPQFAIFRGLGLLGDRCGALQCPQTITPEWRNIFLVLFIETPVLLILAAYLD
jgi:hypothetical protein